MYPEPILINLKAMEVNMGGFYAKGLVQFNYVRLWHLAKVEKKCCSWLEWDTFRTSDILTPMIFLRQNLTRYLMNLQKASHFSLRNKTA